MNSPGARAKSSTAGRLWIAMRSLKILSPLLGLLGCFDPDYHCRLACGASAGSTCPEGFACVTSAAGRVCQASSRPRCTPAASESGAPQADAATADAALVEVGPDASSAVVPPEPGDAGPESPDAAPVPMGDAGLRTAGEVGSPTICLRGECLTLTPALQDALVLWLDETGLPAAGLPAEKWLDRSGLGNDVEAADRAAPPLSSGEGVTFVDRLGAGYVISHRPSLDFGREPFAALVVARLKADVPGCLLTKDNGQAGDLQGKLAIEWGRRPGVPDLRPSLHVNRAVLVAEPRNPVGDGARHLFFAARTENELHLHVDGLPAGGPLPGVGAMNTSTGEPLYVGTCRTFFFPVPGLNAVVLLRGSLPTADLESLQAFLMRRFGIVP
jgi:hypothetical protein